MLDPDCMHFSAAGASSGATGTSLATDPLSWHTDRAHRWSVEADRPCRSCRRSWTPRRRPPGGSADHRAPDLHASRHGAHELRDRLPLAGGVGARSEDGDLLLVRWRSGITRSRVPPPTSAAIPSGLSRSPITPCAAVRTRGLGQLVGAVREVRREAARRPGRPSGRASTSAPSLLGDGAAAGRGVDADDRGAHRLREDQREQPDRPSPETTSTSRPLTPSRTSGA